ncbi:hypothetical protein JTP94_02715, partial [Rhizobium lusitanum]|nr:hypothetical protein [Rhizobium lusitanum]
MIIELEVNGARLIISGDNLAVNLTEGHEAHDGLSISAFKAHIEQFITDREMTPTQFGKKFAGDPLFVFQLRDGREPRSQTRQRIIEAMG